MRWLVSGIAGLVAVAFVSLAAVGGGLYWQRVETRSGKQPATSSDRLRRSKFRPSSPTTTRPSSAASLMRTNLLTPDYRKEFEDRANSDIIPQARARELVSQANVVGVGVMDAQRNSAAVMVYINRTVSEKSNRDQPIYDGARLRVDYKRIGGKWLINYITPI